nr:interleukin-12 receptor subunit beta-2 [Anolis sagrei ordinatus]
MNATGNGSCRPNGTEVTLYCLPNRTVFPKGFKKVSILENGSEVSSSGGPSVSAHVFLNRFGTQTFKCECSTEKRPKLICEIRITAGLPPDQPKNIICRQYGKNGSPTCSWDEGRHTYCFHYYTVKLSNGTFVEEIHSKDNKVDLSISLDFRSTYTVVVTATNLLGNVSSQPIQSDIVKPYSPVNLSVKFDGSDATKCTILWQDQEDTPHFRLRYQPVQSTSWTMVENIQTRRYELHGLKPDTEYIFQVSGRFRPNKGLWSNWSASFQTEAVPFEPSDVWYLKKAVSSQMQNITLFWKAMDASERRSHHYRITFQALGQKPHRRAETNFTVHTVFSQTVPKADYNIKVYSYNLRGMSPPVHIITKLGITDLPPPRHLLAASEANESIVVTWEAPFAPSPLINGYVIEWTEFHQDEPLKSTPNWLKVSASNFTVKIENLKPNVCYHINVFALYESQAGKAASTTENVSAKAPLRGPHINATKEEGRILVFWEEIPFHQQMGCIVNYRIYVQKRPSNYTSKVYEISKSTPQPFLISNVQVGAAHAVWMTASTEAGESPKGNEEIIYIKNSNAQKDVPEWAPVLALCLVSLFACTCCVPPARQKLFSCLSILLSECNGKAVPDPANSSCIKEFTSLQDESSLHFTQFQKNQSSFEDPEVLPIEEVFMKVQCPPFRDRSHFKNSEKGESQKCQKTVSLEEEDPTVKNVNYAPLILDTPGVTNKHPLLPLYRKVAPKEPNQGPIFSDYLSNPLEDITVDYLPTVTANDTNNDEDSFDFELNSFSVFPRTFLSQSFSLGGKLTLDAIRMDCNSYTD